MAPDDLCKSASSAHAAGDCIGPPACKKRRPSGWHRDGLPQSTTVHWFPL